jgi:hypothetical protein
MLVVHVQRRGDSFGDHPGPEPARGGPFARSAKCGTLVAAQTREGAIFHRLLDKLEVQRKALGDDKVFDVLGDAFDEQPLRDLLIEAVRYGDQPERREKLNTIIDATVTDGIPELLRERALHRDMFSKADLEAVRRQMEEAQARRLQPHFIQAFFIRVLAEFGGRINRRDGDRFEITPGEGGDEVLCPGPVRGDAEPDAADAAGEAGGVDNNCRRGTLARRARRTCDTARRWPPQPTSPLRRTSPPMSRVRIGDR